MRSATSFVPRALWCRSVSVRGSSAPTPPPSPLWPCFRLPSAIGDKRIAFGGRLAIVPPAASRPAFGDPMSGADLTATSSPPVESRADLVQALAKGAKPPAEWRIGTEHEKFAYYLG